MESDPAAHPIPPSRRGVAILALLCAVVALPLTWGSTLWMRELRIYTYPQKLYAIARLRDGALPRWADAWGTGRPFLGIASHGTFDPLNALLLLPRPFNVDVFNLAHLAIVMFGARAWLRRQRLDDDDATVGAALLGLSGYVSSMLSHNGTLAWGIAWTPWYLLALRCAMAGGASYARNVALAAGALALSFFSGDGASVLFSVALAAAQTLSARDADARRRGAAALSLACAFALLLTAVQWVPALYTAAAYPPRALTTRELALWSLHPLRLLELLSPDALGEPYGFNWRTPSLYVRPFARDVQPLAVNLYQTLAVLPLALLAVRRGTRFDRALGALAFAGAFLSFGRHALPWSWAVAHVPGFSLLPHPETFWFVPTFALAILAARALPTARAHAATTARIALYAAVTFLVLSSMARRGELGALLPTLWRALLHCASYATAYAIAFGASLLKRIPPRIARALPAFVIVLDLMVSALPLYRWTPADDAWRTPRFVSAIARDRGGDPRGARLFGGFSLRELVPEFTPDAMNLSVLPNVGLSHGVGQLDSNDVFASTRLPRLRREVALTPLPLLRWWGIEYLIGSVSGPFDPRLQRLAVEPSMGLFLYRVERTAPRVYLARESVPVQGPADALAVARSEGFVAGVMATVEGPARRATGRCDVRVWRAEAREIVCESSAPAWLVVGESFDPTWRAEVDGREVPIVRANELYQAVPVPAGRSVVRTAVTVQGLRGGAFVSLVGALALVAWGLRSRARARTVAPPA